MLLNYFTIRHCVLDQGKFASRFWRVERSRKIISLMKFEPGKSEKREHQFHRCVFSRIMNISPWYLPRMWHVFKITTNTCFAYYRMSELKIATILSSLPNNFRSNSILSTRCIAVRKLLLSGLSEPSRRGNNNYADAEYRRGARVVVGVYETFVPPDK